MPRTGLSRRSALVGLAAPLIVGLGGSLAWLPPMAFANVDPFRLGVASGDPSADGFVIWTRLAPDPLAPDGGLPATPFDVKWQVSSTPDMSRIDREGVAIASPAYAHAVHVEVDGLRPGRHYFYRFIAGGAASRIGRSKTLPAAGAQRLRFGSAGCQRYEDGYFTAWRRLAEEDLDFVIHYGDYIYASRALRLDAARDRKVVRELPGLPDRCRTLADYRNRYAAYKLDPDLQEAHATTTFVMSFDDHEVEDGWADFLGTRPNALRERLEPLRTAAFQAWYEHVPLRRAQRPDGAFVRAHRRLSVPGLTDIFVLDTRQHRSPPVCGSLWANCQEMGDPGRTMLGPAQEAWLSEGLKRSDQPWSVLAQQVPLARIARKGKEGGLETITDHWDGASAARQRVLDMIADRRDRATIVISGDVHHNRAVDLMRNGEDGSGAPLGAEFVATSISSGGDGREQPRGGRGLHALNPTLKYFNQQRGYVCHSVAPTQWRADFRLLQGVSDSVGASAPGPGFVVDRRRRSLEVA
jgi:alkaline phosphatase D